MKIETKFDIGQEVYYIDSWLEGGEIFTEIRPMIVREIKIEKNKISYNSDLYYYPEDKLFATREEAEQKLKESMK